MTAGRRGDMGVHVAQVQDQEDTCVEIELGAWHGDVERAMTAVAEEIGCPGIADSDQADEEANAAHMHQQCCTAHWADVGDIDHVLG